MWQQHRLRLSLFFIAAIAQFAIVPAAAAPTGTQIASCDPGPVMIGSGKPTWRRESVVAGSLGIRRDPLREMTPYRRTEPNVLVTKAPILIEGSDPVTLSVPPALTHRVFLYYGFHEGSNGKRSTSFYGYPGSSTVEFQPCADKPRTIWPGGLRVKGRAPVHLDVTVEGNPTPISLPLGRPSVYSGY
jgi:hypothetical protein